MARGHLHEQFEILTSGVRMGVKMYVVLTVVFFIFHLFAFACVTYLTWGPARTNAASYAAAKILVHSKPGLRLKTVHGSGEVFQDVKAIAADPDYRQASGGQARTLLMLFLGCGVVYFGEVGVLLVLKKRAGRQSSHEYIRGARLIDAAAFRHQIKAEGTDTDFPLGQIAMPVSLENRGTLFIGKPGVGKTQAMRPIVRRVIERNEKALIYDYKGDFTSEYYDPDTDLIFNVADSRCLGWQLFSDLDSLTDIDAAVASLIPIPKNSNPFWEIGARGIFKSMLIYLYQQDRTQNHHIWHLLTIPTVELVKLFEQTRGAELGLKALGTGDSRQAEGMMAVLMQYVGCFAYMTELAGGFSIKQWVTGDRNNRIFVTNLKDIEDTLRPILSLFIDLTIRKLLSLPDSTDRKLFYFLDELGTLQQLMIPDLLTTGRSKGACTFIGNQDSGRTEKIYGAQVIDTIDNALGNRITMALSGKTADKEARYNIGETEYWEHKKSYSMGPSDHRDGVTVNKEKRKEPLFLPSDLANLKDLTGLVKLRNYDYVLSQWTYEKPGQNQPGFVVREDLSLARIKEEQDRLKRQVDDIKIDFSDLDLEGDGSAEGSDDAGRQPQQTQIPVSFLNSGTSDGSLQAAVTRAEDPGAQRAASRPGVIKLADKANQATAKKPELSAGLNDLRG